MIVGLSGGVDSAVAAYLLLENGFRVHGVFMHLWSGDSGEQDNIINEKQCCSLDGYEDVRRIAYYLGIPLTVLNLTSDFSKEVVRPFVESYRLGKTPNPCVTCNRSIKFGRFFERIESLFGRDILHATGHYSRIEYRDGKPHLLRARDPLKDQSYFLHRLSREKLRKIIFPLGDLTKEDVREIAETIALPRANKKESQGVCFIKKTPRDFLAGVLRDATPGDLRDVDTGESIGRHSGIHLFTRGQRHGMAIGGGRPYYVVDIDQKTGNVFVTSNHLHPDLTSSMVLVDDMHWIHQSPVVGSSVKVQFRYHQAVSSAKITELTDERMVLALEQPLRAVMPGQAAVVSIGEEILGGGTILEAWNTNSQYRLSSKYDTVV